MAEIRGSASLKCIHCVGGPYKDYSKASTSLTFTRQGNMKIKESLEIIVVCGGHRLQSAL